MKRSSSCIAFVFYALFLAGCAHYPVNARLTQHNPDTGYRLKTVSRVENTDGLVVVLAFSGGGHIIGQ